MVNLKFYQVLDESGRQAPNPSFWRKMKDSISEGWDWLGAVLIGLLSVWPLVLLGGLIWMTVRRQTKKSAAVRR